jgi:hypothetical protein
LSRYLQTAAAHPSVELKSLLPQSAEEIPTPTSLAQLFTVVARNIKACTDSMNAQSTSEESE